MTIININPASFVLVQDDSWGWGAVPKDDPDSPVMGPQCFAAQVWAAIVAAGDGSAQ